MGVICSEKASFFGRAVSHKPGNQPYLSEEVFPGKGGYGLFSGLLSVMGWKPLSLAGEGGFCFENKAMGVIDPSGPSEERIADAAG